MDSRLDLHILLKSITSNVYFQPPDKTMINYPCIIYKLEDIKNKSANNKLYKTQKTYQITLIVKDPDSDLIDKVNNLTSIDYIRNFITDSLYHHIWILNL